MCVCLNVSNLDRAQVGHLCSSLASGSHTSMDAGRVWSFAICGCVGAQPNPAGVRFRHLIELLSAMVVVLQFLPEFPLSQEGANRTAGLLLFALAGIVMTAATVAMALHLHPEMSPLGIGHHDCRAHRHAGFGLAQETRGLSNQQSRAPSRCGLVG
jgi:hypothetical protein